MWKRLTSDHFILDAVSHCHIDFETEPLANTSVVRPQCHFTHTEQSIIDVEIAKLLKKEIIKPSQNDSIQFISPIFTTPKKDGSHRVIFNLKSLNKSVTYYHFKMDTLETAIRLMTPCCFMTSIDLKDAYYSVPIADEHQKYLKFLWRDQLYAFTCLPMGLTSSPRIFTKILKPVFATLRSKFGHSCLGYIDDSLHLGDTYTEAEKATLHAVELLISLGFMIHPEKSIITPTQIIEFLGFVLNSILMIVKLTDRKAEKIMKLCIHFCHKGKAFTIREVASLIGSLISSCPGVGYGRLHYRNIERDKINALKSQKGNFEAKMSLSHESLEELAWWIQNVKFQHRNIQHGSPNTVLFTDASKLGWGAKIQDGRCTNGIWTASEAAMHINILELLAVKFSLMSLLADQTNTHIRIMSDNTTVVCYINDMGGSKSIECDRLSKAIWYWSIDRNIWLSAAHVPGAQNVSADKLSRHLNLQLEWQVSNSVFQKISACFGSPEIDLFASRITALLPDYVSWKPDPMAKYIDAFKIDWKQFSFYAFPPFCLISRCVQKIVQEQATGILVIPLWPTQTFFTSVLNLLIETPRIFKTSRMNLVHPVWTSPHPLHQSLVLMVCKLSGIPCMSATFRRRLPISLCSPGEILHTNSTDFTSTNGYTFVAKNRLIRCIPL